MTEGYIKWDDEDDGNVDEKAGILPDGTYDQDTTIYYCCSEYGFWYNSIELPVSAVPIFVLPYKSKNCQRVKWAISKLQYIKYDTEDYVNHDEFSGSHVYSENKDTHLPTIYYCYYQGMYYALNHSFSLFVFHTFC